jgi:hypothetical protein
MVLLLGIVGAFFHRPLILAVLNRLAPEGAKRAGINLSWKVAGSLWSDLVVNDFKAEGGGFKVTAGHLEVRYDLAPTWRK